MLAIALHSLAVTYMGVPAKYIPEDDLRQIVASGTDMLIGADHRVWLEVRRANTRMPLAMALHAAGVSLFADAKRPGLAVLIGCGFAGYSLHVGIRVFSAAGELQLLTPGGVGVDAGDGHTRGGADRHVGRGAAKLASLNPTDAAPVASSARGLRRRTVLSSA